MPDVIAAGLTAGGIRLSVRAARVGVAWSAARYPALKCSCIPDSVWGWSGIQPVAQPTVRLC
jgi:hypothetical protein